MPTAEQSLSRFLSEYAEHLLELAQREGFAFSVRETARCVTVRCTLPDGHVRYVIFEDHRIENPHGGKPHVCNQWHKAIGEPTSYIMGREVQDVSLIQKALRATAVMCLTQSEAYNKIKKEIFQD